MTNNDKPRPRHRRASAALLTALLLGPVFVAPSFADRHDDHREWRHRHADRRYARPGYGYGQRYGYGYGAPAYVETPPPVVYGPPPPPAGLNFLFSFH